MKCENKKSSALIQRDRGGCEKEDLMSLEEGVLNATLAMYRYCGVRFVHQTINYSYIETIIFSKRVTEY